MSRYPDGWELYDMTADRVERNDVAPQHPGVVRTLAAEWEAWAKRAGVDRWPGPRLTNWGDPAPANEQAAVVHDAVVDARKRARWAAVFEARLGIRTC